MADLKKFLDSTGVGHLWGRVVEKITAEVAKEAARADAAEKVNAKAIADEIARATAAEQVNATAVATEQARAEKKEGELAQAIADEATRAKGVEATNAAAAKAAQDDVDAVELTLGDMTKVTTTAKTVAGAIDELKVAIGTGGTNAKVTIDTTATTAGALKSYTIKQGDQEIGVIDIPKDMVVKSGSVVVNPAGQAEGTYIELVLANVDEPLYINVANLVDIYTAQANAAQVQLVVSADNVISASIVAGSVTATELANDAVTTVKIANENVTKEKLAQDVQTSLGKADAAATKAEFDLEVERATTAEAKALTDAKTYADGVVATEKARAEGIEGGLDTRIQALEGKFGDGEGTVEAQVAAALDAAKADAESKANAAKEAAIAAAATDATAKADAAQAAAEATAAADATAKANKALEDAKADATTKANDAEQNAKDYADTEIAKIQALTNAEIDTAIGYVAPQA